jgi:hypothetical protein
MRYRVLLATMALGVAMSFGHAVADGPGDEYGVREIGTVRFIDRALNLFQLEDGTELHTTDPRIFQNIREGMQVRVDYTHSGDRNELNSVEPVGADGQLGVSPTTGE